MPSSAQWLADLSSDHRTAVRITPTSSGLRSLTALDRALSTGALALDQVAAAAELRPRPAMPGWHVFAVGEASQRDRPGGAHDRPADRDGRPGALCATRAEHVVDAWSARARVRRRLPLEQGAAFEQAIWSIAKAQRAVDKQAGTRPRVAAIGRRCARHARPGGPVTSSGGARRSRTTVIVHLHPTMHRRSLEGAGPVSPETAERLGCDARRLTITRGVAATSCTHASGAAPPTRSSARCTIVHRPLPVPRLHCHSRARGAPRPRGRARRQDRARQPRPALPPPPQAAARSRHRHERGDAEHPTFRDGAGRVITANQPHAPPRTG